MRYRCPKCGILPLPCNPDAKAEDFPDWLVERISSVKCKKCGNKIFLEDGNFLDVDMPEEEKKRLQTLSKEMNTYAKKEVEEINRISRRYEPYGLTKQLFDLHFSGLVKTDVPEDIPDSMTELFKASKIFCLDADMVEFLSTISPPKERGDLKLPFPNIFVNIYSYTFCSNKNCYEGAGLIPGIILSEENGGITQYALLLHPSSNFCWHRTKISRDEYIEGNKFLWNFLAFLHHPERCLDEGKLEYKTKDFRGTWKNKMMPCTIVRVKGVFKEYIRKALSERTEREYAYRFWVRGHWRTLHDLNWWKEPGTRIWIDPFIKGHGELIEKKYLLEKSDKK